MEAQGVVQFRFTEDFSIQISIKLFYMTKEDRETHSHMLASKRIQLGIW